MANALEFDLQSIDRDHVAIDRMKLNEYLKQRGTFAVLDHLCYSDQESGISVGVKAIRPDDWWTEDHIPGRPMFPGALMIETAAQIASYDYSCYRVKEGDTRFVGFGGVDNARFRGVVEPPSTLYIVVKLERAGSRMFKYATQGFVETDGVLSPKRCFEADVLGVIL
ncbi:MAG: hypothetical protein AAGB93_07590 [Planctomycetota bacterium]